MSHKTLFICSFYLVNCKTKRKFFLIFSLVNLHRIVSINVSLHSSNYPENSLFVRILCAQKNFGHKKHPSKIWRVLCIWLEVQNPTDSKSEIRPIEIKKSDRLDLHNLTEWVNQKTAQGIVYHLQGGFFKNVKKCFAAIIVRHKTSD